MSSFPPSPKPSPLPDRGPHRAGEKSRKRSASRLDSVASSPCAPLFTPPTHRRSSSSAVRVVVNCQPVRQALSVEHSSSSPNPFSPQCPRNPKSPPFFSPSTSTIPIAMYNSSSSKNSPRTSSHNLSSPCCNSSPSSTPSPHLRLRSPEPSPLSFRFPQTPKRPRRSSASGFLNEISIASPVSSASCPAPQSHSPRESSAEFLGPSPDNEFLPSPLRRSQYLLDYPHDAAQLGSSRYQEDFETLSTLHAGEDHFNNQAKKTPTSVYLVCHRITGIRYVVKKIPKRSSYWKSANCPYEYDYSLSAFREARALATVSHPHIATYHSSWIESDHLYLQLEYCPGGSLNSVLDMMRTKSHSSTFPIPRVLLLIRQIGAALAYLASHRPCQVHCGVAPSNILIIPQTEATNGDPIFKLSDFKRLQLEGSDADALFEDKDHIELDAYLPTPISSICPALDVFSLGLVAFELACEGRIPAERLKSVDRLKELRSFPDPFGQLILQMIHPNSHNRPSGSCLSLIDPLHLQ